MGKKEKSQKRGKREGRKERNSPMSKSSKEKGRPRQKEVFFGEGASSKREPQKKREGEDINKKCYVKSEEKEGKELRRTQKNQKSGGECPSQERGR